MELFVILEKDWKALNIVTKSSILDVLGALDADLVAVLISFISRPKRLRNHLLIYISCQMKTLRVRENELTRKHLLIVKIFVKLN